jgi:hypothetical protein
MGWPGMLRQSNQGHAQQQAELEERTRLALWRMDSSLMPLMVEEGARPYFAYKPFAADRAYTKRSVQEEVLSPSPLLTFSSSNVWLHFQFDAQGRIVSPQVPVGKERELAEAGHVPREKIELAAARLAELRQILNQETSQSRRVWRHPRLLIARRRHLRRRHPR